MLRSRLASVFLACTGCAGPTAGLVVSAPSYLPARAQGSATPALPDTSAACGKPWKLDVVGGEGRVVVVCAHDVRRAPLDESSAIARALSPALDPARERVCACAGRVRAPPFVDLVFTAQPEEGRVTVRAGGDDDLDPELGRAFVACIGSVVTTFTPLPSDACEDRGKASFVYPVRLELEGAADEAPPF